MIALYGFLSMYALWLFYLAVMNLQRARDAGTLTKPAYCLGLPILYIGLALDCFVNLTVLSIILIEPPHEWLVTSRLERHFHGSGWRQSVAIWFAVNLLDTFDPSGKHIH